MAAEPPSSGSPRRLRGLNPAALMAQGLGARDAAGADRARPEIPGYELLDRLGEGGMGQVFLARQLSLDREVAVKLVRRELLTEEWFLERLEREAHILARLRHPHLVTVHDFLRLPEGGAAVVMELLEGGSLRDRLRAAPAGLPLPESLAVARQVAAALAAAHAAGVVHRDVKPENILLDPEGRVRVTDFGMALSLLPGALRLSRTGSTAGTPGYLAPEHWTGAAADHRVDVFSFGVLLYELLTGRLPLGSFNAPRQLRPEVSPALEAMILQSLKPDPAERPQSMGEWVAFLDSGQAEAKEPSSSTASRRFPRRSLVFTGLAAGLTAGAFWFSRHRPPQSQAETRNDPDPPPAPEAPWNRLDWPEDLAGSTISGTWRREGDTLLSGDEICLLALTRTLPAACDLKLTFRRLGGSESVALFFRHPAGHGSCELDGWSRHASGVQTVSGRTSLDSGFEFLLLPDRDYELGLELRADRAGVSVNGELKRTYPLVGETLTVAAPWLWNPGPEAPALALGTYQSPMRFHRLLWRDRTAG